MIGCSWKLAGLLRRSKILIRVEAMEKGLVRDCGGDIMDCGWRYCWPGCEVVNELGGFGREVEGRCGGFGAKGIGMGEEAVELLSLHVTQQRGTSIVKIGGRRLEEFCGEGVWLVSERQSKCTGSETDSQRAKGPCRPWLREKGLCRQLPPARLAVASPTSPACHGARAPWWWYGACEDGALELSIVWRGRQMKSAGAAQRRRRQLSGRRGDGGCGGCVGASGRVAENSRRGGRRGGLRRGMWDGCGSGQRCDGEGRADAADAGSRAAIVLWRTYAIRAMGPVVSGVIAK